MSTQKPISILLVEDNPADVRLTQEAFKYNKVLNELHVVEDGVEAMQFLKKEDSYEAAPTPDIILLDLNLPLKSGKEVLEEIKVDETLKLIPVVILTTSEAEVDVIHAYSNHVNCYIAKPVNLDKFIEVIKKIEGFWLSIVKLPPHP